LLQFLHRETGIEPAVLAVSGLDAEIILRFLDALEKDRAVLIGTIRVDPDRQSFGV
jgi:hypothetical protein